VVGDFEPAELAIAAAGEEGEMDEVAEGRRADIQEPGDLALGQIANDGEVDRLERFYPAPGVVGGDQTGAPGVVERGLQVVSTRLGVARRRRTASESLRSKAATLGLAPGRARQRRGRSAMARCQSASRLVVSLPTSVSPNGLRMFWRATLAILSAA